PEEARAPFVEAFASSNGSAFSGGGASGLTLPESVPADLVEQVREAALTAVHAGFSTAVAQTRLLTVAVLVTGLLASLPMSRPPRGVGVGRETVEGQSASRTGPLSWASGLRRARHRQHVESAVELRRGDVATLDEAELDDRLAVGDALLPRVLRALGSGL